MTKMTSLEALNRVLKGAESEGFYATAKGIAATLEMSPDVLRQLYTVAGRKVPSQVELAIAALAQDGKSPRPAA